MADQLPAPRGAPVSGTVTTPRPDGDSPRTTRPHEVRVVGRPWWARVRDAIANRTGLFWIVTAFGAFWTYGFFREARRDGDSLLWSAAQAVGMSLAAVAGVFLVIILLYLGRAGFVAFGAILDWLLGRRRKRQSAEHGPTVSREPSAP